MIGPQIPLNSPPRSSDSYAFESTADTARPAGSNPGRRRLLAVAAVLIVLAGGLGAFLGAKHSDGHWRPLYQGAVSNAAHWKVTSARWSASSAKYEATSLSYHGQLHTLQAKVTKSVGSLAHPHFLIWNSCTTAGPKAGCAMTPGREWVAGLPDTFTYYVRFHATVPVTMRIMSMSNYVCYETGSCAWHGWWWQNRKQVKDGWFRRAEGCAGYVAVFTSTESGTLYPDISITRRPASKPTGDCRQ